MGHYYDVIKATQKSAKAVAKERARAHSKGYLIARDYCGTRYYKTRRGGWVMEWEKEHAHVYSFRGDAARAIQRLADDGGAMSLWIEEIKQ